MTWAWINIVVTYRSIKERIISPARACGRRSVPGDLEDASSRISRLGLQPNCQRNVLLLCYPRWVEWLMNGRVEYWVCPFSHLLTSLIHSLASHCSVCSRTPLWTFACSLVHLPPSSWERGVCPWSERVDFMQFQPTVGLWMMDSILRLISMWHWKRERKRNQFSISISFPFSR